MTRPGFAVLAGFASLVVLTSPTSAAAHPIHTTLTTVTVDARGLVLSVRGFADDLSASIATFAKKAPPADWAVPEADAAQYLAGHVRVSDASGRSLPLRGCGVRRERDVVWLCLRVDGVTDVRVLQVENRILTERHADQVNIVQVDAAGSRKTLLFTKDTRALPFRG
jgi:hypothetical protein